MKIAYLSDAAIPSQKANSIHVINMCNAFRNLGHEVLLFGLESNLKVNESLWQWYGVEPFDIELHAFNVPKLRLWLHAWATISKLKKFKPDLVFGRSLYGCFLAQVAGYKVFYETHDPLAVLKVEQKFVFERLMESKRLGGVVVLSNALKEILVKEGVKVDLDKVLAVHDGATISSKNGDYEWPVNDRNRIQVGYVGTISKGRGVEIILALAASQPTMDFHIIGGNREDLVHLDQPAKSELPNVYFHGFIPPADTSAARSKCDILLAPYQEDLTLKSGKQTAKYMSPLKIFEYMEAGKAIISSDLPVLREVLTNEENALMVEPDNVTQWKEALIRLAGDEVLRNKLSDHAFSDFQNNFTWKVRGQHILNFVKEN